MTRLPYLCDDLDASAWPRDCRDFTPSLPKSRRNRDVSRQEYDALQARCAQLAADGDATGFAAAGCKRQAHRQLPQGRHAARYGEVAAPKLGADGRTYLERLRADEGSSPLTRRTQSPRSAPDVRAGAFGVQRQDAALQEQQRARAQTQIERVLRQAAGPSGRLTLNRAEAVQLLAQLEPWVEPARADALLAALPGTTERTFGPQTDDQGKSTLPEIAHDLAFQAEVLLTRALWSPKGERLNVEVINGKVNAIRRGSGRQRLVAVRAGGHTILIAPLLQALTKKIANLPLPTSDEEQQQRFAATQTAFFRRLRRELLPHPSTTGDTSVVFVFGELGGKEADNVEVSVPRSVLQHSDPQFFVSRARRPDYARLVFLTLPELSAFLAGVTARPKRRTLRGRQLSPLDSARENPMGRPKFINFQEYADLLPGETRVILSMPAYCVYRKTGKAAASLPFESQFEITTCARAQSWQRLNARDTAATLTASPKENPMQKFDPIAELMKEYGPRARVGQKLPPGAPEYNDTYPASGGYGPYGLSQAPYGGQAMLPVNRRNPRTARFNPEPLDMRQPGLKWRDFVKAYGRLNDKLMLPTPLASQKWAEYKQMHGIVTDPKVAARLAKLAADKGKKKARANCGDSGEYAPATPWDEDSQYELVRGAYGPYSEMPPVNRRNPRTRRNPGEYSNFHPHSRAAPEFTDYKHASNSDLTFMSNTGDELASQELARRNPSERTQLLRRATEQHSGGLTATQIIQEARKYGLHAFGAQGTDPAVGAVPAVDFYEDVDPEGLGESYLGSVVLLPGNIVSFEGFTRKPFKVRLLKSAGARKAVVEIAEAFQLGYNNVSEIVNERPPGVVALV